MYKNILLAYDGSDLDQKALIECNDLTNWPSAQITLLTVSPNFYTSIGMEGAFVGDDSLHDQKVQTEILNIGVRSLRAAGYNAQGVALTGDPAVQIADYAKQNNCDLIIVGHKHKANWAARWWGTFKSKALIELAPCSVLIVILKESMTTS
ncbi:MAG: universal stress protein [Alcaligenaceae bacterium]|jgi:nucleotide-binding universal stress UspA family protein